MAEWRGNEGLDWMPSPEQIKRAAHTFIDATREIRMAALLRCKLRVSEVTRQINPDGSVYSERVALMAVSDGSPENKEFSKWTPGASFNVTITNPTAYGKLANGHEFYVDFTPAE